MLKIAIILGSTRPGRNGEAVAKWVHEIAKKRTDAEFELVDMKDFNLPLLDEPMPPIAIVSALGFAFAKAISSFRFCAGILGLPTSKLGTVEIIAIGVKSATGSNGNFG